MRRRESDINTAILISGSGTTAETVIRACRRGEITRIRPVVVISSRPGVPGLARSEALGVPTAVVQRTELLATLRRYHVDLVSQNGWLPLTPTDVIDEYGGRIINQHPGRLPAFGGKGMFGARVTCATLAYFKLTGEPYPWTASVVHHVTATYDEGPLIQVCRLDIAPQDTHEDLAERTRRMQAQLLPIEHDNVKSVLTAFGDGMVPQASFDNTLFQNDVLQTAKDQAIQLFPKG